MEQLPWSYAKCLAPEPSIALLGSVITQDYQCLVRHGTSLAVTTQLRSTLDNTVHHTDLGNTRPGHAHICTDFGRNWLANRTNLGHLGGRNGLYPGALVYLDVARWQVVQAIVLSGSTAGSVGLPPAGVHSAAFLGARAPREDGLQDHRRRHRLL